MLEEKWMEIPLPNGCKIFIDNVGEKGILIGLINSNGYTVSDRILTKELVDLLKEVMS
jgi:hypothetical protein